MGWDDPDIYHQPERFGLTQVAFIDYGEDYAFDFRVVWKHSSGIVVTARDSGCSCPSPFEDFTSLECADLLDYSELEEEVADQMLSPYASITAMGAADFLNKVRRASKDAVRPSEVVTHIRRAILEAVTSA